MKRCLIVMGAVVLLCLYVADAQAHPRGRGGWGVSFYSAGPAYYAPPPPIVYAPAPVPVAPVYVQQRYYYPAPYYYVPPPPPRAFFGFGF